jgi:hypothetical protein
MSGLGLLEVCMILAQRKYHRGYYGGLRYDGASWEIMAPFKRLRGR